MADLDGMKNDCDEKLMIFDSLLSRHDPSGMDPLDVQENYKNWNEELSNALSSLVKSVRNMTAIKAAIGADIVNEWKQRIAESEKRYRDHRNATYEVVASTRAQAVLAVSAQVKTAEVKTAIEAERVVAESKELENEISRYDDWGDATNEEIEEAMRNTEEWKRRLSTIQDRIYSMKENVQLFDLPNCELTKSMNIVENLKVIVENGKILCNAQDR